MKETWSEKDSGEAQFRVKMTWIILSYALSVRDSYIPASRWEDKGWKIDDMLQAGTGAYNAIKEEKHLQSRASKNSLQGEYSQYLPLVSIDTNNWYEPFLCC